MTMFYYRMPMLGTSWGTLSPAPVRTANPTRLCAFSVTR